MGTAVPASKDGSSHTPASFPSEDRAETAARERIAGGLLSGLQIPVRGVDTVTAAAPWSCIASKPRPFTECGRRYANPTEPRTSRGYISRGASPFSLLFNPLERCRFSAAGAGHAAPLAILDGIPEAPCRRPVSISSGRLRYRQDRTLPSGVSYADPVGCRPADPKAVRRKGPKSDPGWSDFS